MSDKQVAAVDQHAMVEKVVVGGDLSVLNPQERLAYYKQVCESVGLNPLTRPFEYIRLNNKLTLYAKRDATDQLRSIKGISIKIAAREKVEDLYIVTAQASDKSGRTDESVGAVNLSGLKGEYAANAIMKAETKAKRRVTLSIAGLGFLDETEVQSIPGAIPVNLDTGEVTDRLSVTTETVGEDKIFKATVWFREMIEVDQIEENFEKVREAWSRLNNNERIAVDAQLNDTFPGTKKKYKNILKEYLAYQPSQEPMIDSR